MARKSKYSAKDFGGYTDALVKLGRHANDTDRHGGLTVTQLMKRLCDRERSGKNYYLENAIRNERYFHGLQLEADGSGAVDDLPNDFLWPDAFKNYLRNMVQTWASRFQEDRPIVRAYPGQAEGRDIHAAKLANTILEELHWREGMDAKLWQSAVYAQLHGKVGLWTTWDRRKGREILAPKMDPLTEEALLDEDGSEILESLGPEGEVSIELLTVFDYDYYGGNSAEEAEACVRRQYIDEIAARAYVYEETGVEVDISAQPYETAFGGHEEGVLVEHLCYLPSPMIPEGLWAVIVGGNVAVSEPYPEGYAGMLPLNEYKINPIRHSRFATSHVNDALPLQRFVNEMEKAKVETVRKVGVPKLVGLSEVIDSYEEGVHGIALDDVTQVTQGARFLEPPAPAPLIWESQAQTVESMFDIFGLNEVLVGKDSVKAGTSAKQIAYLSRLDSMKMSGAVRNFEVAYLRTMRLALTLTREYVKDKRLVRMSGPGGELQYQAFRGADLQGVDVHLEPNSGLDKFRAQQSAEVNEELQLGTVSPQDAVQRRESGLDQTVSEGAAVQQASQLLMAIFRGEQVQPDPSIPPPVAIEVLQGGLGIFPAADQQIRMLIQAYTQIMQQAQMQQAGGPQGQPSPAMSNRPQSRRGQPTPDQDPEGQGLGRKGPL